MRSEGFFQQLGEVAIGLSTMSNVVDSVYFQPHWQEFYKGLKLSKGCDMLCFTNVTIPDGVIDLDHLMKSNDILGLFLDNNGIRDDQIGPILRAVRNCPVLQFFHWQNNIINRVSDLDELVSTVIGHPEVDNICLENCLVSGRDWTEPA